MSHHEHLHSPRENAASWIDGSAYVRTTETASDDSNTSFSSPLKVYELIAMPFRRRAD